MRYTGVYKITNLVNGKFYIGQSRDIYTRWKAHTMSITDASNESVIRMAFAKYRLRKQVSKEGVFGNFKFEILELCEEDTLLEREAYYISDLKPEYNIMLVGANPIFPKRDTQKNHNYLQYHSFEKMGYLPGESEDETISTENITYGIYTKKRVAINMLGASVILILGGKPKGCDKNRYYLWSELVVEDIQFDHEYGGYIISGIENLVDYPIDLTDIDGFQEFKMKCGNFAFGLQPVKNKEFYYSRLLPLFEKNKIKRIISYNQWIDEFLANEEKKYA